MYTGSPTLVAQGVYARLTRHIPEALLPQGKLKVSKIVMCIGIKLYYCLKKLQIS